MAKRKEGRERGEREKEREGRGGEGRKEEPEGASLPSKSRSLYKVMFEVM